jgi:hypothetical protein
MPNPPLFPRTNPLRGRSVLPLQRKGQALVKGVQQPTVADLQKAIQDLQQQYDALLQEFAVLFQFVQEIGDAIHVQNGTVAIEGRSIVIHSDTDVAIDGVNRVQVSSATEVRVDAPTTTLTSSTLRGQTAMARFDGVVQCDTIIANSVVGASYTPGAGNVW